MNINRSTNFLSLAALLSLTLTTSSKAESWLSDLMVRIFAGTPIGTYFMDDTQKAIYGYERQKKEIEKIRGYFEIDTNVDAALKTLQDKEKLKIPATDANKAYLKNCLKNYIGGNYALPNAPLLRKTRLIRLIRSVLI